MSTKSFCLVFLFSILTHESRFGLVSLLLNSITRVSEKFELFLVSSIYHRHVAGLWSLSRKKAVWELIHQFKPWTSGSSKTKSALIECQWNILTLREPSPLIEHLMETDIPIDIWLTTKLVRWTVMRKSSTVLLQIGTQTELNSGRIKFATFAEPEETASARKSICLKCERLKRVLRFVFKLMCSKVDWIIKIKQARFIK